MNRNYELLIAKINEFTQKFYLNKLLRGSIYASALLLALYLILFVLIYYTHPGTTTKTVLFFGYLAAGIFFLSIWVVKPALAYFKMGKNLSIEQASAMIGAHFFHVRDKLLNTLQLKAMADASPENSQLILAGIDQKINELTPIPFSKAIKFAENKKYIKYFLVPATVILLIALIAPAILKEGTSSFVQYDKQILPQAPFHFQVLNTNLLVAQGDDLPLELKLNGNEIPQDVYVTDGINTYKLEKESPTRFNYTFKNLQQTKELTFTAGGFSSAPFVVEVKPRPLVIKVTTTLVYPGYLNRKTERMVNAGDLLLPEGTHVTWALETKNSSRLTFTLGNKPVALTASDNLFSYTSRIHQNSNYSIVPKNDFISSNDSLRHQINVIKDEFPGISVNEAPDSLSSKAIYFSGRITDDHGFSALKFIYIIKEAGKVKLSVAKAIPVNRNQRENAFFYFWDLKTPLIKPGQTLEYYFEVADNDGVNGPKRTKSELKLYAVPSFRAVTEKINEGSEVLKQKMEKAIQLAGRVEKESKKLGETLLDKKQISFDDKKQIEQLLEKQKQLEAAVAEINELNKKNTIDKAENDVLKDELAEKQKQIDDLFNNVLDEKTKSLLQKLQQLMDQNNKEQTRQELSKMQMDNKSLKNELDRILELYKQLEFEQGLKNNIDRLNDLAKAQKDLAKQSTAKDVPLKTLQQKQEELSQSFNDVQKELKKLDDKNQELEHPNAFKAPEKAMKDIAQELKNSAEQLDKNDKKKASENQQKAGDQMEQQADKLEEMQQASSEMESNLNVQELRQLLENLLKTSFNQEQVMLNLRRMNSNDPQYTGHVQKQREIKDNMKTISDSLFNLSKRVPQIETAVNEEMQKINFNIDKSLEQLGERNTAAANKNQQYTMTSINNLSLMLNEALDQLQDMKNKSKGGGKGNKKQGMKQLQQLQEQLNNRMQQARDQLEKTGNKGSVPKGKMSEEFAKMAQQQQMLREALQKINREENKDGKGGLGNLNQMIEDMKATESDLVNKRLEQETLKRQKDLLTKLLAAENAQREQDQDSKREARAGKDLPPSYQKMLEKFKSIEKNETEWLQKLPPTLNYYYRNKIAEYFKLLNSGQ